MCLVIRDERRQRGQRDGHPGPTAAFACATGPAIGPAAGAGGAAGSRPAGGSSISTPPRTKHPVIAPIRARLATGDRPRSEGNGCCCSISMPLTVRQYEDHIPGHEEHRGRGSHRWPGCEPVIMSRSETSPDEDPPATGNLVDRLLSGLPAEALLTDPDVTASYANDMASFCAAGTPAVVVLPRTVEQVQHVMRTATELRVPVVPQGARTGLSGAANASDGCIVLSLTKMDHILEISPVDRIAVVEPGVINATLSRAVGEHGLYYPPDPSSWEMCTIGGNIGTASGGLCCVKYGVTAEYVLGLDVVLADGRLMSTGRRTAKGVAGYDLTRLFVGSEGSLGIVVRATLALRPQPPQQLVLAAEFASTAAACDAVCRIMAGGHVPSLLELMDRTTVKAVNAMAHMGLPETTEALLLAAFDTLDPAADLAAVGALCEAAGATQVVPPTTPPSPNSCSRRGGCPSPHSKRSRARR